MIPRRLLPALFATLLLVSTAHAAEWILAYENDFESGILGPEWILSGTGEVVNGALVFGLKSSDIAVLDRPFAADVKVRMQVEAHPAKPPCDLSIGLACATDPRPVYGILAAFGGMSNTGHQIIGGGDMPPARIKYVENVIVPGQAYVVEAVKDGKDVALFVDGEELLRTQDQDILGGPGYDRIGLVTWNGMIVHEVQVFERAERNPETPVFLDALPGLPLTVNAEGQMVPTGSADFPPDVAAAVQLFNDGRLTEAETAFLRIADLRWRAAGAAYCIGHVYYIDDLDDNHRAGALLQELAAAHRDDAALQNYGVLGGEIARLTALRGEGLPNAGVAVKRILAPGPDHNPYYDKARFYQARFLRANAMEGASPAVMQMARDILRDLYARYPENPSLKELNGESVRGART